MSRDDSTIVPPAQVPDEDVNRSHDSPENQQRPRRRRNKPGNPDPRAKVIALSPRELLAKADYFCQMCPRVFQTQQKLQVHQRSHSIPWIFQPSDRNDLKPVYVCPEPTCVHHNPLRALSDITGIKKHYYRKHCEPKWRCDKCRKMYAVEADLKAHRKICSTYRCECGRPFPGREECDAHRQLQQCGTTREEMRSPNDSLNLLLWLSEENPSSNHPGMVSGTDLISTPPVQHEEVATGAAASDPSSSSFFGGLLGSMNGQQQNEFQSFAQETPYSSSSPSYFHQVINLTEQSQGNELQCFGPGLQFFGQDPVVSSSFPFEIPNMETDYVAAISVGLSAPTEGQGRRMDPPIYSSGMVQPDQGGLMTVPFSGPEVQPAALLPIPSPSPSQLDELERLVMED
ncbi:protein indeterminate-domain 11-like [Phoenix dactylifera]|uniref:Protein indeterminate-domain 11-like n=1 Tax=Phoenix dactylifera TaxID=42345 RepID=A0A8B7CHE2_PHODC|nr:protein indeterminate-domain 11-like [Phoenix dactylifera]